MAGILDFKHLLKFSFFIFDLCFVINFDRTHIVELNWEFKRSGQSDGSSWKL